MPRADEQPWSPFPVQDWSSLPEDPLAGSSAHAWPAPRRERRWWLPLVVFAVIGALVGGAAAAWHTVGLGVPRTTATGYVPSDGAAVYEVVETTRDGQREVRNQVTESARFLGPRGVLSTDTTFATQLIREVYEQRDTLALWRTVSTVYDDPAAPYATTRVYRANAAVELLGESGPGKGYVYRPALVELPVDVAAGAQWSSTGSANDTLDYFAAFRAAAAEEENCLRVSGEVRYTSKVGQPGRTVGLERTWCPDRGLVAQTETAAGVATSTTAAGAAPPRTPEQVGTPLRWTAPERWTEHKLDTISIDPNFGEKTMSGSPKSLAPARTESGLVVRPLASVNDLVGLTPKTPRSWVSVWRAHVPGDILELRAFGNVILVTTSARRLVAFSDLGIRLWSRELSELAAAPPVRASETDVVVVDLAGVVRRLSLATGAEVWRHRLGSDVTVSPAVGAGLVLAMDRGGTVTALDLATGERRWTKDLEGLAAGFVGDTAVVLQDQTAHGLDPATGDRQWLRPFTGTFTGLVPLADRLVLATKSATVLLDDGGRVTSRRPGYLRLTASADRMVGWGPQEAEVFDAAGAVSTRWPLPGLTVAVQDRFPVGLPQGVLLVNDDWTFTIWSDEP